MTSDIVNGIKLLFSLIPAGFLAVCGILLFYYPVNDKLLATIESDLKKRKDLEDK